jgi:DNA-binding NarL/FixJ family response regulator
MAITVLLADDHTIVREGLRLLLEAQKDIVVVGEAADGRETVRLAKQLHPDVVIMDIAMPAFNGIAATQRIKDFSPSVSVIILSMHASNEYIFRALQAGASGYLLKESAGTEVVKAVRAVDCGQRYLSGQITETVIEYIRKFDAGAPKSPLESLSDREREVLQLVVEGKTNPEIAHTLSLSVKTVETYKSRLMNKLEIKDIPSLVKFAITHGLTPLK